MLNLMIGLNGYTLCSGLICEELNGSDYRAVPFRNDGRFDDSQEENQMEIGYVTRKNLILYKLHICKADIRNPLSLLAHERSRFATCQWELLTPTDISIPPYPPLSAPRT